MLPIQALHSFEQIKLMADPRRLRILRILMSGQASLTMLGQQIGEHPAWVRHHLKQLEAAGLVELAETKVESGVVEKFYRVFNQRLHHPGTHSSRKSIPTTHRVFWQP